MNGNSAYSNSNSFATLDRLVRSYPWWFRQAVAGQQAWRDAWV